MKKVDISKLQYDPDEMYERGMSPFQAIVMAAQEARFINESARQGFYDLNGEKPTTIAMARLREDKIKVIDDSPESSSPEITDKAE